MVAKKAAQMADLKADHWECLKAEQKVVLMVENLVESSVAQRVDS